MEIPIIVIDLSKYMLTQKIQLLMNLLYMICIQKQYTHLISLNIFTEKLPYLFSRVKILIKPAMRPIDYLV